MLVSFQILLLCLKYDELFAFDHNSVNLISQHGYPSESHTTSTKDGYILNMFRIPFSSPNDKNIEHKPVAFLMHGLTLSSDSFLLNGPENGLPYMLADAGYDVWLGNSRGNKYSRKHVEYSPGGKLFWQFSWHDIGINDMPAQIDYVLSTTGQNSLHYIGHSEGATVFLVMLAMLPDYTTKIKTTHLLAPIAFSNHAKSIFLEYGGCSNIKGIPEGEFEPDSELMDRLTSWACPKQNSSTRSRKRILNGACNNLFYLISGGSSKYTNKTIVNQFLESSNPTGVSSLQMMHYIQLHHSAQFRAYDYGMDNWEKYGTHRPPNYYLYHVEPRGTVHFYYSDNDAMADSRGVLRLTYLLPKRDRIRMKKHQWNHMDFIFSKYVKKYVNDVILNITGKYEKELF